MKITEVIKNLVEWHEPFEDRSDGRDKFLAGNPDQECKGIAVTVCATYEVLEKAVEKGCNLIISHESIFFGGQVDGTSLENNDVYQAKKKYIEDHNLVVWRDHDRMHGNGLPFYPKRTNPDCVFYGIMRTLNWEQYISGDKLKPLFYEIPETTGRDLAELLMEKFNLSGCRIVGNPDAKISKVWFCEHVNGGRFDGRKLEQGLNADCMIPLEICDYTLTQYVHDAAFTGQNKVILEFGHFNIEEIGMRDMLSWIKEATKADVDACFIQSGDYFNYLVRKS